MKDLGFIEGLVAVVLGLFTFLFGNYDLPLQVALTLMLVDYISGSMKAWSTGTIASSTGRKGLVSKASYLLVIIVANVLDMITNVDISRTIVCYIMIANEAWSILENAGAMGAPIPPILYEKLEQLKHTNDTDKYE